MFLSIKSSVLESLLSIIIIVIIISIIRDTFTCNIKLLGQNIFPKNKAYISMLYQFNIF